MRKGKFWIFLVLAYPLSASLGWYAGHSTDVKEEEVDVSVSTRVLRKSQMSGEDRLNRWFAAPVKEANKGGALSPLERTPFYEEIRDSLEASDNPEGDLYQTLKELQLFLDGWKGTPKDLKQLARYQAITGALWEQWMKKDPDAAFAAVGNPDKESGLSRVGFYDGITSLYLRDHGLSETLELLRGRKSGFVVDSMRYYLATEVARTSSVSDLKMMVNRYNEDGVSSDGYANSLAQVWDLDRKGDLLSVFREDGIPRNMIQILASRLDKKDVVPWLRELADDENLDRHARSVLAYSAMRESQGSGLSLDERIEFANELFQKAGMDQLGDIKSLKTGMVTSGIGDFLRGEEDWAYAFRHGVVSADEVLTAAKGHLAEVSEHEKEVRSQLYRHLAEEDPERAMELYDGVGEDGQNWQKIYAMRWWFSNVNPNEFMHVMEDIDFEWGQDEIQSSLWEGWRKNTGTNLDRYGEDYINWVMQMPDGIHKGRALQTLGHEGEGRYPGITSKVEAELEAMRARKGETE